MIKILEKIVDIVSWCRIAISPTLIGIIIGIIIILNFKSTSGLIAGTSFSVLGLIIGIIWATRIWKTKGTTNFIWRIDSTKKTENIHSQKK